MEEMRPMSFDDFWLHYLRSHSKPQTRVLHFFGTTVGLTLGISGLFLGRVTMLLLAVIFGYGVAWFAHLVIEGNKPESWNHAGLSLLADLKLFVLTLGGKMEEELRRAQL